MIGTIAFTFTPGTVVLLVIAALVLLLTFVVVRGSRRAEREQAARVVALGERGSALGLGWLGEDAAFAASLPAAPLLPERARRVFDLQRGQRQGRELAVFDYTWIVHTSGRPSWNAENIGGPGASHGFPDRTCALAVVKLEPRLPLPEFLLQPNGLMPYRERAAAAREALTGATGAIAGIERAVVAEAERRAADAPDPEGLRFAERPDFYARWLLTGPDESALRRLFVPALLDDLLVRPGWLVCSAGGSLLISVELRDWPPTQPFQHRVPIGKTRLLPPEQLPALLDGALEIAAALERAASA